MTVSPIWVVNSDWLTCKKPHGSTNKPKGSLSCHSYIFLNPEKLPRLKTQTIWIGPVIGSAANHYVEVLAGVFNAALCKVICFSSPLQILTFVRSLSIKLNVLCNLLFVSLVVFYCFCSFVVVLRDPFWHIYNEKEPLKPNYHGTPWHQQL